MINRKAISPVIAVIIIIAVTIAIAVAVAGWMMGLWGSYASTEALTIMPDSYIEAGTPKLVLYLKNGGTADAVVYKVTVAGSSYDSTAFAGDSTIAAGGSGTLNVTLTGSFIPGNTYSITVYTESGKQYQAVVVAKQ